MGTPQNWKKIIKVVRHRLDGISKAEQSGPTYNHHFKPRYGLKSTFKQRRKQRFSCSQDRSNTTNCITVGGYGVHRFPGCLYVTPMDPPVSHTARQLSKRSLGR